MPAKNKTNLAKTPQFSWLAYRSKIKRNRNLSRYGKFRSGFYYIGIPVAIAGVFYYIMDIATYKSKPPADAGGFSV